MRTITLEAHEARIDRRRRALGYEGAAFVARNDGSARTADKRALLDRLDALARETGRHPRFGQPR